MASSFTRVPVHNVGTTPQTISMPGGDKGILLGFSATNVFGTKLPITAIIHHADATQTRLVYKRRVDPGEPYELLRGNKIILLGDDTIEFSAPMDNAFDCLLSILSGVR